MASARKRVSESYSRSDIWSTPFTFNTLDNQKEGKNSYFALEFFEEGAFRLHQIGCLENEKIFRLHEMTVLSNVFGSTVHQEAHQKESPGRIWRCTPL